jgi:hypothetical protein
VLGLDEGSRIEEAEVSGSEEGEWCTTYPSLPNAMNMKIYAFTPEAMVQHFRNKETKWFSFNASSPEDVGLEEVSLIEEAEVSGSDEGK